MADETRMIRIPMTFDQWKSRVNRELAKKSELVADDLPDWDYWSAWNDGTSPEDAAQMVLEEAGFPED